MKKTLLSLAACAMMAGTADAMYIVGNPVPGDWSPANGIEMEKTDGGWKWTGTIGDDQWFAFATQLGDAEDWNTFNSTYRLSPQTDGDVADFGSYNLVFGHPAAFKGSGKEATFHIFELNGSYTLNVTEPGAELDIPTTPMYIFGSVEGSEWNPARGLQMQNVDGGWLWSGTVGVNDYFCFGTQLVEEVEPEDPENPGPSAWDIFNENYRLSPVTDNPDGDLTLEAKTGEYALRFGRPEGAFHGTGTKATYFIKEVDGAYTLSVEAEVLVWGVVGEFNSWGDDSDWQMTEVSSGVWEATIHDFSGQFKFRANNNWAVNYGWVDRVVDENDQEIGYAITKNGSFEISQGGGNFCFPEVVKEVVLQLDLNENLLKVSGLADDGVPTNEIATGKARYFNLQGVEVAAPTNGIFIRVIDGRSEKITVK